MLHQRRLEVRFGLLPQLRRDAAMLLRELRGESPAPFQLRRGTRRVGLATRRLRVARVERETADAVTIFLEDPTGAALAWRPGQFFTLLVRIDGGEILRRAYSACWPAGQGPVPGALPLTIKRVAGGRVSTWLHEHVRAGDLLEVLGPSGAFTVPDAAAARELVLIGGGSGITPLAALAHAALAGAAGGRVTLLYGNRAQDDVIFAARLDALVARHPGRLRVRHVLAEPGPGWTGGTGVLDQATCTRELDGLVAPDADAEYFVCGPGAMMDAARASLRARGVPDPRVHEERFASPCAAPASAPRTAQALTVLTRAGERRVVAAAEQTLLEAGLAAGLPMPYSCAMGGCGACKVRLTDGRIAADDAGCLTTFERERGYVLACQARATTPCTIELPE